MNIRRIHKHLTPLPHYHVQGTPFQAPIAHTKIIAILCNMKTLLINNHTKHLDELASLFPECEIIQKEDLRDDININEYDLLVISGGSDTPSAYWHPEAYKIEVALIREATIPVLGICLGSEIVTQAYSGKLKELSKKHKGNIEIDIQDESLKQKLSSPIIDVYEAHEVCTETLPEHFIVCATSEHGIEIMKHESKPVIGIQFHPEVGKNAELFEWVFETLGLN